MDSKQPQGSRNPKIPTIVLWTGALSLFPAFVFAIGYQQHNPIAMYLGTLSEGCALLQFTVSTGVFLVLFWTPLLGGSLGLCLFLPKARQYCDRRAWLLFVFMLLPCYECWRLTQIPQ